MKLIIRTDAKNIEDLIKKHKLYLEGTTNKMCMVSGYQDKIKSLKDNLDASNIAYFDYVDKNKSDSSANNDVKDQVKQKRKKY